MKLYLFKNVYVGPDTIYECNQLHRGTMFQFRLRSENEAGPSNWSEEISYRTAPECPGRPTKPQVKGKIHANCFKVKWEPPMDRGGADIKMYHLEINSGAAFERIYTGENSFLISIKIMKINKCFYIIFKALKTKLFAIN